MFVKGITFNINEEDLRALFSQYGFVESVILSRNLPNIQRDDYAFVNFHSEYEADSAIKHLQGVYFHGIPLDLSYARKTDSESKKIRSQISATLSSITTIPNIPQQQQMNNSTTAKPAIIPSPLYKTQLCRHFMAKGYCKIGALCQYAHGEKELREYGYNVVKMPMIGPSLPPETTTTTSTTTASDIKANNNPIKEVDNEDKEIRKEKEEDENLEFNNYSTNLQNYGYIWDNKTQSWKFDSVNNSNYSNAPPPEDVTTIGVDLPLPSVETEIGNFLPVPKPQKKKKSKKSK